MLVNAPLVDQLADVMPGDPNDENARANCVPASLASGLMALLPGQTFYADALKDDAYGEGYTGATDPPHFVAVCAAHGVTLAETPGTDAYALLRVAVAALDRHEPATLAIPSQWGTQDWAYIQAHPGSGTHEVLLCDCDGVNLTAMNPWPVDGAHAFYQTMPLAWWATRLCYNRVFVMRRAVVTYKQNGDGSITYPNGVTLAHGTAAYVVANQLPGTPYFAETYFDPNYGVTPFDDGVVLTWDKVQGRIRTDLAGLTINQLVHQLAARPIADDDTLDDAAMADAIQKLQAALNAAPNAAPQPEPAPAPTPPTPASAGGASGEPLDESLVVRFGDTLAALSQRAYGDPSHAAALAAANGIIDPDLLPVGRALIVPELLPVGRALIVPELAPLATED